MKTYFTCLNINRQLAFPFFPPHFKTDTTFTQTGTFSTLVTPDSWPFHDSISLCSAASEIALCHLFACVLSWGLNSQHQLEPADTTEHMLEPLLAQHCCCPVALCICTRQWLPAQQLWMWRQDLG